ncbi:MAG: KpsF/GutQ family sugar-phosphate isomerase [Puniceicoccales bacterium]|jgi:arabinose-5-phosphate isomerase|nr:KpsF/GutQ family sugar-phosphate isomerase [Puniceicoccales bacterium]
MEPNNVGKQVLQKEAAAILETAERLTDAFGSVANLLAKHSGKIITCGVGKSGFIARKVAATFTSIGKPSVFLHATEALHGDLGVCSQGDPIIFFSRSGSTGELLAVVPILRQFNAKLIAIVGNTSSALAKRCDYALESFVDEEADPLAILPTTSAITALALGDALASAIICLTKFRKEDFLRFHPGGQLGRNLLLKVSNVMHHFPNLPHVPPDASVRIVLLAMTENPLGACCIVGEENNLLGIITDGDIRRLIQRTENLQGFSAQDIACHIPRKILPSATLGDAIAIMEMGPSQVGVLPVVDECNHLLGLLRLHDAYGHGTNAHV